MEVPLLCLPSDMRNMFRRKWCLSCGSGYKWHEMEGRSGLLRLADPGLQRALTGRAAVGEGGPTPGLARSPSLQGTLCSGWPGRHRTMGMGQLVGTPGQPCPPTGHVHSVH